MRNGDKVQVEIVDASEYSSGAAACLNGKTGVVEMVTDKDYTRRGVQSRVLVRFDEPAKPWWRWQTPPIAFWFLEDELTVRQPQSVGSDDALGG